MGGLGELNTGRIILANHSPQDIGRGQYRKDTNRPLSTGWVVWERSMQDGLYKQTIVYKTLGEVNTGRIQTGHYLQDGWYRRSLILDRHKQAIIYRIGGVRELLPFREEDHASVWYHMWWQPDNLAQTLKYIFVMWTE